MEGSLPFFLFFMKRSMEAWISMDYMRGLLMLKDYVETGTVASKVNLKGIQDLPHLNYIGKETQCTIDEIGPAMDKDFDALKNLLKEKKIQPTSKPLCIYVDYDLIKKNVHYIAAIPVEKHNHTIPDIFMNGMIPETKAYEVQHIGSYTHLGNAWSTGYSLMQNNVFKKNKQLAPFEVYANDPATIAPGELITKIYFPVK
jgi:predicted transcriptional regulator YdeE